MENTGKDMVFESYLRNIDMESILNKIRLKKLYIDICYDHINLIKEDIESNKTTIQDLVIGTHDKITELIVKNLPRDAKKIEEMHKERENSYTTLSSASTDNGEFKYTEEKIKNDNIPGYFDPETDKWNLMAVDYDKDTEMFRLQIEAVKNRKYLGYGSYEPDLYWTSWFKI